MIVFLALLSLLATPSLRADPFVEGGWEPLAEITLDVASVEQPDGSTDPIPLVVLEAPEITEARYLVAGEVRYENASGFLEMWNHFGEGRYFSRTLGEIGPMAKLSGSSEWRLFMLPFNAEKGKVPDRLEVNVILPGGGSVELRNVKLYQTGVVLATPAKTSNLLLWVVVGFAILGLTAIGGAFWRRHRAAHELRKMTAADL